MMIPQDSSIAVPTFRARFDEISGLQMSTLVAMAREKETLHLDIAEADE